MSQKAKPVSRAPPKLFIVDERNTAKSEGNMVSNLSVSCDNSRRPSTRSLMPIV